MSRAAPVVPVPAVSPFPRASSPPRGLGLVDALAGLPEPVVAAFAVVTLLADPLVLFGGLALWYWRAPALGRSRDAVAATVALGLAGLGLTLATKAVFGLARPPGAGTGAVGPGFPSGHALGATAVYGGAAALWAPLDRRRLAGAALVVAAVALSRLVLGVHYLVDTVAGVAAGTALVAVVVAVDGARRPGRAFALAAGLAAVALALVRPAATTDAAAGLGGALGGLVGWRAVAADAAPVAVSVPVAAVALALTAGLWGGVATLDPPTAVTVAVDGVAVGLVVGLPGLVNAD
jgi:membrane-associated phospholipid phosphatase